jgi:diacylglycerol O-acyltransferase / wax synthase
VPVPIQPWSQCLFNLDHATLEDDPDFKIENHVKFHQSPEDASEAQLMETALAIFRKPLDRKRPLWEVHLFNVCVANY